MKKTFRFSILFVLLIPIIVSFFLAHLYQNNNQNISLYYISIIAVLFEVPFLNETGVKNHSDNGIISGFLFSLILSISCYYTEEHNVIISGLLVFLGLFIRYTSKRTLKSNFSHSLRIKKNHELIQKGIYKKIRHPAYLGTFLIILGITSGINFIIQIIILILTAIFIETRTNNEENMLKNYFGIKYDNYCSTTKKYLPFIY